MFKIIIKNVDVLLIVLIFKYYSYICVIYTHPYLYNFTTKMVKHLFFYVSLFNCYSYPTSMYSNSD